jgi:WD40 repeat protein
MSSGRVGGVIHSEVADMGDSIKGLSIRRADAPGMSQSQSLTSSAAAPNYKPQLILSGHKKSISSVKFSPDGSMLASAGVSLFAVPSTHLQTV